MFFVIHVNLLHSLPSLFLYGLLLSLWSFSIFIKYYFQVSFNLTVIMLMVKITQIPRLKELKLTEFANRKSSRKWQTASFCSHINTNLSRQEAGRWPKSKHSLENFSEINAILAWATKCWMSCKLSTLCYALMNSIVS